MARDSTRIPTVLIFIRLSVVNSNEADIHGENNALKDNSGPTEQSVTSYSPYFLIVTVNFTWKYLGNTALK